MANSSEIGRVIKGLRIANRLTQRDLADLAGMSVPTLAKIEAGDSGTTLSMLEKVLSALGARLAIDSPIRLESLPQKGLPRGRRG